MPSPLSYLSRPQILIFKDFLWDLFSWTSLQGKWQLQWIFWYWLKASVCGLNKAPAYFTDLWDHWMFSHTEYISSSKKSMRIVASCPIGSSLFSMNGAWGKPRSPGYFDNHSNVSAGSPVNISATVPWPWCILFQRQKTASCTTSDLCQLRFSLLGQLSEKSRLSAMSMHLSLGHVSMELKGTLKSSLLENSS